MAFLCPNQVLKRDTRIRRDSRSGSICPRYSHLVKNRSNERNRSKFGISPSTQLSSPKMVTETADNPSGTVQSDTTSGAAFSAKGMTVEDFFEISNGEWKSQRSSHNLVWGQFEAVTSEIKIEALPSSDEKVIELCKQNDVSADDILLSLSMSWEGESDWDDDEVMSGSTVMSVIKDGPTKGRLLRSMGYAEEIPAVGQWEMTPDGVFVLNTFYDAAAAEERIWFATPDLRMRVSQIRTSSGRGIVTASFSTEIRS